MVINPTFLDLVSALSRLQTTKATYTIIIRKKEKIGMKFSSSGNNQEVVILETLLALEANIKHINRLTSESNPSLYSSQDVLRITLKRWKNNIRFVNPSRYSH